MVNVRDKAGWKISRLNLGFVSGLDKLIWEGFDPKKYVEFVKTRRPDYDGSKLLSQKSTYQSWTNSRMPRSQKRKQPDESEDKEEAENGDTEIDEEEEVQFEAEEETEDDNIGPLKAELGNDIEVELVNGNVDHGEFVGEVVFE